MPKRKLTAAPPPAPLTLDSNILTLWLHHIGETEIDRNMHFWSAIGAVASCVADRVGFHKFIHKRLAPNIYTLFVGTSSCGKNEAIDIAESYLTKIPAVNYFRGKITGQGLMDQLARAASQSTDATDPRYKQLAKVTLATPELAMAIGTGGAANDFVRIMTELYSGGDSVIQERTRTSGYHEIERPCVNWRAGSTKEWLCKTITPDDIQSGFFGRICTIQAAPRTKRIVRPKYPANYDEVRGYITSRLGRLAGLHGAFTMTPQAEVIERDWYEGRDAPDDESLDPFFGREHDLMLKLAMILSLCESERLVMEGKHVAVAQDLVNGLRNGLPDIMEQSLTTPDTKSRNLVAALLQQHGSLQRSMLLRMLSSRGVNKKGLDEAVLTLREERRIRELAVGPTRYYEWIARKRSSNESSGN